MIVVHAGHRVDNTDQKVSRFPNDRVGSVYRRAYLHLLEQQPEAVVSAAANGADLVVLRAAEDLFIPFHVVLPIPMEDFRRQSVDDRGSDWSEAFDRAIDRALSIVTTSELTPFDDWYLRGNDFILDTAASLAGCDNGSNRNDNRNGPAVAAFAVLCSDPSQAGSTGDFVAKATDRKWPVHTIDPLAD